MTRQELFNKIWKLPNFPYRYMGETDHKAHYILLGYSGSNQPVNFAPPSNILNVLDNMIELYEKSEFSEDDKTILARSMHRLQGMYEYRFENSKTKVEHQNFIDGLNDENFIAICKQVEMYVFARKLYGEGYR